MAADLISLDEYLAYTAQVPSDLDPASLAQIDSNITAASEAIRTFTNRNLALAPDEVQTPRQYRYDGYGFVEIDDAEVVNSVSTVATSFATARTLDATEWFAFAEGETPVITDIEFYTRFLASGLSPEMGFKRNLDRTPWVPYPTMVTVDAVWGWPNIPEVVKRATVWTVETFINFKGQSPFNSEAIASYSRSFNQFSARSRYQPIVQALPEQAVAVLEPYSRIST